MNHLLISVIFFIIPLLSLGAADSSVQLVVKGNISPFSTISMDEPQTFSILDGNGDLIPSKKIGDPVIVANWPAWKIELDSQYKSDLGIGRLKLDGADTYIPYTFALMDGETLLVSRFMTKSPGLPRTTALGKTLSLFFYFSDDDTRWPAGIYRDTLVFSLTAD